MPVPIAKFAIYVSQKLAGPILKIAKKRILSTPGRDELFYYWFGLRCYKFEAMLDRVIREDHEN